MTPSVPAPQRIWRAPPNAWHDEMKATHRLVRAWCWCNAEDAVRVDVSPEAEAVVRGLGGRLWVWAARPWGCCWGTPAYMNAATAPPARIAPSAFSPVDPLDANGLEIWFRAPGGRLPDVLEIAMKGKRHPRVEAYWDGCSYML